MEFLLDTLGINSFISGPSSVYASNKEMTKGPEGLSNNFHRFHEISHFYVYDVGKQVYKKPKNLWMGKWKETFLVS